MMKIIKKSLSILSLILVANIYADEMKNITLQFSGTINIPAQSLFDATTSLLTSTNASSSSIPNEASLPEEHNKMYCKLPAEGGHQCFSQKTDITDNAQSQEFCETTQTGETYCVTTQEEAPRLKTEFLPSESPNTGVFLQPKPINNPEIVAGSEQTIPEQTSINDTEGANSPTETIENMPEAPEPVTLG